MVQFDPRVLKIEEEAKATAKQRDIDYEVYMKAGRIWGLVPKCRITKISFPRVSQDVCKAFLALDDLTSSVSDVLDSYGIEGAIPSSYLKPVITGKKIAGPAITIRNTPERKTPTQGYIDHELIKMSTRDIYYLAEPGDVLVTDFCGNLDVSNMGGMSCKVGQTCGLAANIANGAVRDVDQIREMDYPVWSCGTTQKTGKFRLECMEMNGPISLCGRLVEPGDLMIADDSGVCVVPYNLVDVVLEKVQAISKGEDVMWDMIVAKKPLDELRPLVRGRYK